VKPGDLVRIVDSFGHPVAAQFFGKTCLVVSAPTQAIFGVLIDGCIRHFYQENLEVIDETR
jgi:hypothetical protein